MLNSPKHVQLFPCIRYMVNNFENAEISETEFILYLIKEMRKKKIPDRDINKYLSNLQLNTIGIISNDNKNVHLFNELDGIKVTSENNYITIADEILKDKYELASNCTCKSFLKNFNIQNLSSKEYREPLCSTCPYSKNYNGKMENAWNMLVKAFKDEEGYKSVVETIDLPEKYFNYTIDLNTYHGIISTQEHFTVKLFLALFNFLIESKNEVFADFNIKKISSNTLRLLLEPLVYLSLDDNKVLNYERIIESILVELYNDIATLSEHDNIKTISNIQKQEESQIKNNSGEDLESLSLDLGFDNKFNDQDNKLITQNNIDDDVNYDENFLQEYVDYAQETINIEYLEEESKPYTTLPLLSSNKLYLELEKNKLYQKKLINDNSLFGKNIESLIKIKRKNSKSVINSDDFSKVLMKTLQVPINEDNTEIEKNIDCTSLLPKSSYQVNDAEPIVVSKYILDGLNEISIENSEKVLNSIIKDKLMALECVYSPDKEIFLILFNRKLGYIKLKPYKEVLERFKSVFEMNSIVKITYMPYALLSVLYSFNISCKNIFSLYTALGCIENNYAKNISEFGFRMITKPFYNEEYLLHMIRRYPAVRLTILDEIRVRRLENELDNLFKRDIILGNSFLNQYIYINEGHNKYLFELKGFNQYITNDITDSIPQMKDAIFFNIKLNLNVLRKDASVELYYLLSFLVAKNYTKKFKIYVSQFNESLVTFMMDNQALSYLRDVILNELTNRLDDFRRERIKGPLFEYLIYRNRSH